MDGLAPSNINVRLSAVRKLVAEARASGLLGVDEAARLTDVPNLRQGTRLGNWLTKEQARELLQIRDYSSSTHKQADPTHRSYSPALSPPSSHWIIQ